MNSKSLGLFAIVNVPNGASLYRCLGSHHIVYTLTMKKSLLQVLIILEVTISPDSIFIIHCQLQHISAKFCSKLCLCYHIYEILIDGQLKKAIQFDASNILSIAQKSKHITAIGECSVEVQDLKENRS